MVRYNRILYLVRQCARPMVNGHPKLNAEDDFSMEGLSLRYTTIKPQNFDS